MKQIRLIKSRSFTDGTIKATRENPVVSIEDDARASELVQTGFFAYAEDETRGNDKKKETMDEGSQGNGLPYEEVDTPTAAEMIEVKLEKRSVSELKKYAEQHGVSVTSSKKKDLIDAIVEAEKRAGEAREALRQE